VKPCPAPTALDAEHWAGTARGELPIQRCGQCARWQWPAAYRCPGCGAAELEWTRATGRGTLHTYTVIRVAEHPAFAGEVPYNVAVVELDEGPLMLSSVVDVDPRDLVIGMPLEVVFEPVGGQAIPKFRRR
jgi:uncharacterized OB-fold protein